MRPGFLPRYATTEPDPEQTITIPDEIANAVLRIVEEADAFEARKQAEAKQRHAEETAKREETERIIAQLPGVFRTTHPTPLEESLSRTEAAQRIADLETKTQKIADLEKKANNLNSRLSWIEDMR